MESYSFLHQETTRGNAICRYKCLNVSEPADNMVVDVLDVSEVLSICRSIKFRFCIYVHKIPDFWQQVTILNQIISDVNHLHLNKVVLFE